MAAFGGLALRTVGTAIRVVQFAASIVILGIFSYFLAELTNQNLPTDNWIRAVEGISGAAALYTLLGLLLTFFLGGVTFFAFLAIVLDICFVGCYIAVSVLTRGGDRDCGYLANEDPLNAGPNGFGSASSAPSTYHACTLMKACFILAILNAILFVLSAPIQLIIARHHQKEKREGTAPKGYLYRRNRNAQPNTPVVASTKRRGFFRRDRGVNDVELGRASYDTSMTGNTAIGENAAYTSKPGHGNSTNYRT